MLSALDIFDLHAVCDKKLFQQIKHHELKCEAGIWNLQ